MALQIKRRQKENSLKNIVKSFKLWRCRIKRFVKPFNLRMCRTFGHSFEYRSIVIFGIKTNELNHDMGATIKCRRCGTVFVHKDSPLADNAELNTDESSRMAALLSVAAPCNTCSDLDTFSEDEPCCFCGPPAWEHHNRRCRCIDEVRSTCHSTVPTKGAHIETHC